MVTTQPRNGGACVKSMPRVTGSGEPARGTKGSSRIELRAASTVSCAKTAGNRVASSTGTYSNRPCPARQVLEFGRVSAAAERHHRRGNSPAKCLGYHQVLAGDLFRVAAVAEEQQVSQVCRLRRERRVRLGRKRDGDDDAAARGPDGPGSAR